MRSDMDREPRVRHSGNILHAENLFAERQRDVRDARITTLIRMFDYRLERLARVLFAHKRDDAAHETARTRLADVLTELDTLMLTDDEMHEVNLMGRLTQLGMILDQAGYGKQSA